MIPKKLHFVWIGPDLPDWANINICEWQRLNPGYEIYMHGEDAIRDDYRYAYETTRGFDAKADLLRYSVLQEHGGWYFDTDFWPLRPIDDIVAKYELTADDFLLAEQHYQKAPCWTLANGVIGAAAEHRAWERINRYVVEASHTRERVKWGPMMVRELQQQDPEIFRIAAWPWFFPASPSDAPVVYHRLCNGENPADVFGPVLADTCWELPFVLHMWQNGDANLRYVSDTMIPLSASKPLGNMAVGLVCVNAAWKDPTQPFVAVRDGLRALGCETELCVPGPWPCFTKPDVIFVWNTHKRVYDDIVRGAAADGVPLVIMEHGFFDRREKTQFDPEGFAAEAGWARKICEPAPMDGLVRLRDHSGYAPQPMRRRDGYILILAQVDGDAQMRNCEIHEVEPLVLAVGDAAPEDVEIRLRHHPLRPRGCPHTRVETIDGSLQSAISGAKFVVTINSNSGNDALLWGCPVLCLGPATYAMAGAAKETTLDGMADAIQDMLDGWQPDDAVVSNYLAQLACHEFTREEIATGRPLLPVIREAMRT